MFAGDLFSLIVTVQAEVIFLSNLQLGNFEHKHSLLMWRRHMGFSTLSIWREHETQADAIVPRLMWCFLCDSRLCFSFLVGVLAIGTFGNGFKNEWQHKFT